MSKFTQFILDKMQRVTAGGAYMREVDGLRFVAILPVVLQHLSERFIRNASFEFASPIKTDALAYFISRGTVGVFLFFAISGFILALPFAKYHLRGGNPLSIKSFYKRRLTRLEPPYIIWMCLFATVLIVKGAYSMGEIFPHLLASLTYLHTIIYNDYSVINPVAWSLEIEIQFYLLAPFLAAAYFGIKKIWVRRIGLVVAIVGFVTLQHIFGWAYLPYKVTLLGQLQHFLVGFLIADYFLLEWQNGAKKHFVWDILAILGYYTMTQTWTEEWGKTLVFALAMTLLFAAAFKGIWFRKMLGNRWIAVTGGMCYTIYLTHLPLLEALTRLTRHLVIPPQYALNLAIQCAIILPIVWLFSAFGYLILEKPFMHKDWHKNVFNKNAISNFLLSIKTVFSMRYDKMRQLIMKITAMFSFVLLVAVQASAQSGSFDIDSAGLQNLKLKPLSALIEAALLSSRDLKKNTLSMEKQNILIKNQKVDYLSGLRLTSGGSYGNGGGIMSSDNGSGQPIYSVSNSQSLGTSVGLAYSLPLGELFTRKNRHEVAKIDAEFVKLDRETIENNIKARVTELYQQLELAVRVVQLKAQSLESMRLALEIADKYFRDGNMPVVEYSRMLDSVASAEVSYETAKFEAKRIYAQLREICGGNIRMIPN